MSSLGQYTSYPFIPKNRLFGAICGPEESSSRIYPKMQLPSTANATAPLFRTFYCPKWKIWVWSTCDGATSHTARQTMDQLRPQFGERLISRFGPVNWPPRSCDLTPLDYFLWSYVKSFDYADKPITILEPESNITRIIGRISA